MNKAIEFFEYENIDSIEKLSSKLDSFLLEIDNKEDFIKELIKKYQEEKKKLESDVRESRKTEYNPEVYIKLKNVKKIIRYLSNIIKPVKEEVKKEPKVKIVSQIKKAEVKPKIKKQKTKEKVKYDDKTLYLVNNINNVDLNLLNVDELNNLIKYYRSEITKMINNKIAIRNKKDSDKINMINKISKEYESLISKLMTIRNEKNVPPVSIKKPVDRNLRLPISTEQIIQLDKFLNINSYEIIKSIDDINCDENKLKIEQLYNIYITTKNKINAELSNLISSKRKIQNSSKENEELLQELNKTIDSCNSHIIILNKLISYLKPFQSNKSKHEENKFIDEEKNTVTVKQQEILEHMELELDIISNNIKDIVESYKNFLRKENNITIHWTYVLKITNLIIQKLSVLNSTNQQVYINMIRDALKYQNSCIAKNNIDEKAKIKELQTIWKDVNVVVENDISIVFNNYKEQIKNIINFFGTDKEEASLIWIRSIDEQLPRLALEELEKVILDLLEAKKEIDYQPFKEELKRVIIKNMYIFENYFDIYMMHMEIPKDKKNILESLKNLIENNEKVEENDNKSYRLFHTMLFEEKDLSALKRVLSLEPRFINVKNYDGRYFLESLLDLYINQIMNDKYYFLENTFDIYFKYAGIYMDQDLKNRLINQIKETKESYSDEYNLDCILSNLLQKLDNIILLDTLKTNEKEVYIHKKNNPGYHSFKNMLNRNIITIDQNDTKFFENAISCDLLSNGNYQLGIYVSDIVDCLNQDLTIENNDLKHKEFKTDVNRYKKYILKERKVKLALAFTFVLDEELEVLDFKIERARIRVKKNLTIDDATKILDEGDSDSKIFYILQRMNNVARKLYRKRNPKGHLKRYMDFIPEIQREFTYFVNRYVAALSEKENMPLIYKNQIPRNSKNLYELLEDIYSMSDRIEKIMEIAESDRVANYSTINRGNDLFDGNEYTQITSPTRDLPSLLNQILIINNYIDNEYISEAQKQDLEKTLMLVNHYNNPKK